MDELIDRARILNEQQFSTSKPFTDKDYWSIWTQFESFIKKLEMETKASSSGDSELPRGLLKSFHYQMASIYTTVKSKFAAIDDAGKRMTNVLFCTVNPVVLISKKLVLLNAISCYFKANEKFLINLEQATYLDGLNYSRQFPKTIRKHLDESFANSPYLDEDQLNFLKKVTNLTERQISQWFTNKRRRAKCIQTDLQHRNDFDSCDSSQQATPKRKNLDLGSTFYFDAVNTFNDTPISNDNLFLAMASGTPIENWLYSLQ